MNRALQSLLEGFETRRFSPGVVSFSKTKLDDPHLQKAINEIEKQAGISKADISNQILAEMSKFKETADKTPILYATIADNIIEDTVYKIFSKHNITVPAPKFDPFTFNKLVRYIKADHTDNDFLPLRSHIEQKYLHAPKIILTGPGFDETPEYKEIETAAASPKGEFIFHVPFMQKLMNWANLKSIHPKGKKYKSNGGDIPDEYAYIEFLIIHEFMHYTYDDFHYQKIIPNANHNIINWVGDFRTNYLLVKSGYDQLPMGLFNDHINFDRQKTYIEMYRLVESEFKKLSQDQQKKLGEALDKMGDDHGPGQQQGKESEAGKDIDDPNAEGMDKKHEKTEGQMEGGKDTGPKDDKPGEGKPTTGPLGTGKKGGRGSTELTAPTAIDYSKIMPTFNWATIIKRFIQSGRPVVEETYMKPSRRTATGLHVAAQMGAAAVKPGEKPGEYVYIKLAFVVDSSGSMSDAIEKIYSNIHGLLRQPRFSKSLFTLLRFSNTYQIFACDFRKNQAEQLQDVGEKPKKMTLNLKTVFNQHFGTSTNFTEPLALEIQKLLKAKYNVIIFSDSDIVASGNFEVLMSILHTHKASVFVVFDSRDSYIKFRQAAKGSTPNITYFE